MDAQTSAAAVEICVRRASHQMRIFCSTLEARETDVPQSQDQGEAHARLTATRPSLRPDWLRQPSVSP